MFHPIRLTHVHIHTYNSYTVTHTHAHTHMHTCTHACMHARTHACTHACTHTNTHTHTICTSGLSHHMQSHEEQQPSSTCGQCGKTFSRSDNLAKHLRLCTGHRPPPQLLPQHQQQHASATFIINTYRWEVLWNDTTLTCRRHSISTTCQLPSTSSYHR